MSIYKPVREELDLYDLNWTIKSLTETVTEFADRYGVDVADVTVTFDWLDSLIRLSCLREPTAQEIARRKRAAKRAAEKAIMKKQKNEAKERREYERLKKKFES